MVAVRRRLPVGAELLPEGTHFRVWAPLHAQVSVVLESVSREIPLEPEGNGYFSGWAGDVGAGTLYRYRLGNEGVFPDPASRFQPEGPHGPSQVVAPDAFAWTDAAWPGIGPEGQILYEMHIGTFTQEGTWAAAERQLPGLADLGFTVLEIMPVADFPGNFGWGYDGVCLFAPTRLYGSPDDFRSFVDRAHALNMGVILDVVYNHLGPSGNYWGRFADSIFSNQYKNEWGEPLNFDGPGSGPVREFFLANAVYWITEFHLDGLRLDATQQIFDASPINIQAEISRRVRQAGGSRSTYLIGENEPQNSQLVRPTEKGGYGLDALWNDDFHHSAMVALSGHSDAYYSDYRGTPQELISSVKFGFLFQGQRSGWQKKPRGTPAWDLEPFHFVTFLQNHDQVANSGLGTRCHEMTSPGVYKALTALLLLGPGTPMLFQGQEFAASTPFFYFADHPAELAKQVRKGRGEFLAQFRNLALPEVQACLPVPSDVETFRRCKLNFAERDTHRRYYDLHRDLLRLRKTDPVFRRPRRGGVEGAVLGPAALILRFFGEGNNDRLLVMNLGLDLHLPMLAEPLAAPPLDRPWKVLWSTEDLAYGGCGMPALETPEGWRIPGHAAIVLTTAG